MEKKPINIGNRADYDDGVKTGHVIECRHETGYAIPDWEERGYPDLAETFPTIEEAEKTLHANGIFNYSIGEK